ncbi:MAG: exopolysaccharide biosynthesis polyprenyl glycosylphosphotransferase [Proteobacteria bacterium]|nr:exopolysaccharide biosynthesis polyprenyl glycosylphosphotransferase [Pseudomonadota bacterium]
MTQPHGLAQRYAWLLGIVARLCDLTCVVGALVAACWFWNEPWFISYAIAAFSASVLFAIVAPSYGLYRTFRTMPAQSEVLKSWLAWLTVLAVLLIAGFATGYIERCSRSVLALWCGLTPLLVGFWRFGVGLTLRWLRTRGRNPRSVAVAGASHVGRALAQTLLGSPWMGVRFAGFYDDRHASRLREFVRPGELEGNLEQLVERARAGEIDVVYVALPLRAEPRIQSLVRALADTTATVSLACDFGGFDPLQARFGAVGEIAVMGIVDKPFSGVEGWLKRLEDLGLSLILAILAAVPMLLIGFAIKLSSRGPILIRERCYGPNGSSLNVLRFRTSELVHGTALEGTVLRRTAFGDWLRRAKLDRLPQLLQVLGGSMSLVGPRPLTREALETYRTLQPPAMRHHRVAPGIIGWAEVDGVFELDAVGSTQQGEVGYDVGYLRSWSVGLDLAIMWKAVRQVAIGQGAARRPSAARLSHVEPRRLPRSALRDSLADQA